MLGATNGRPPHPLSDAGEAQALVAGLPADALQALAVVTGWLGAVEADRGLGLARKLEIVDLIGRIALERLRRIEAGYLAGRASPDEQAAIGAAVPSYAAALAAAWLHVIRQFQVYFPGWGEIRDRIPLATVRAMRALSLRLKWQLLRYAPVDAEIWLGLCQLWAFAEDRGFAGSRVRVEGEEESTAQSEFLQPMMLAVSSAESLPPAKLDIAARLIAHLSDRFVIQRYPAKSCHFSVDIDAVRPPARFVGGMQMRPGMRFFGAGGAEPELETLAAAIASEGAIPNSAHLDGVSDVEAVIDVLGHLGRYWQVRRQGRTEERRRSASQIAIVHGFEAIVAMLSTEGAPDGEAGGGDLWTIENESESGYGAIVPPGKGEWAKVGTLLGVKAAGSKLWAAGIVRRIAVKSEDYRYIGIQLLARGAKLVTFRPAGSGGPPQIAVLLPSHLSDSLSHGEMSLLLRGGSFSPQVEIEMHAFGHTYLLEPRMMAEGGQEFDLAYYRVLQRAG